MCLSCWKEAGSPTELPENVDELIQLIKELYATEMGGAGGPLHIVLDDWNLEDDNIEWCLLRLTEHPEDIEYFGKHAVDLSIKIALWLYRIPEAQRYAVLHKEWHA